MWYSLGFSLSFCGGEAPSEGLGVVTELMEVDSALWATVEVILNREEKGRRERSTGDTREGNGEKRTEKVE